MPRWLFLVTATASAVAMACSSVEPLDSGFRSADALARAVLEAIAGRDRARLESLALDEREFRDHVWPDLPAARAERNLPFSYVWGDLHQKSQIRLSTTLQEYGGKAYRLERVRFGPTTSYTRYLVHRETAFEVIDQSGAKQSLRVCGAFLEKDGVWKVFSFAFDD